MTARIAEALRGSKQARQTRLALEWLAPDFAYNARTSTRPTGRNAR